MASLRVLAFDHEGRTVQFDTWLDDLQLYLLSDIKDSVSLFDHVPSAATAPPTTADSATRSQWLSRDAAARFAIYNHLPLAECAHFAQHRTAQALDACYRAAVPAEFLDKNQPPIFITLYFIVTRLPDSLRSVRDQFLSLDPTSLTVDLLEQHLLTAETSAVAVGAARGTPRPPFFEGCSPSPLAPSYASAATADVSVAEDVGAASASAKRLSGKGKGGKGGGGGSGSSGGGSSGGGGGGGTGGGSGGSSGGNGGSGGSGGGGGSGSGGGGTGARRVGSGGGQHQQQQRRSETQSPQQLCEWFLRGASGGSVSCPYVFRTGDRAGQTCGRLHTQHRCFSRLEDAWRADAEGDCYRCVPPDPRIATAALGATESGTLPAPLSLPSLYLSRSDWLTLWGPGRGLLLHCPPVSGGSVQLTVRSLPPLPPSPAPPCLPCVEGRQRAAPHSSSFPPTTAPLQSLHMDVWGQARVSGQSRERYFLLVVDDYTRYTTVFPLHSKGQVVDVLIPWICTVRLQLRGRFSQDLPVLRLHSGRGGEFSSNLLRDFYHGEGILMSFTLPDSPQQNGIAERHIGLVMEVARTSMIHAAAPHFLWPFAVRYAAHQLNLWPRVSLPETSPTLRWTGEVVDASMFRVWGSRAFVCNTSADKLSPCAIRCVFLGFVFDAPGWQFYHPTSRRVFPSEDVTLDKSVPFYRLFPYRSAPPPPVDPLPPHGPAPSGVSQVDPLPGSAPVQVAVGSGAARGVASGGAASGGAGSGGAETGGAEPEGVEPGGAASEGVESGGAEPQGAALSGGSAGARAAGAGGTGVAAGAGVSAATGPGGARTRGTGAAGTSGVEGAGARDPTDSGATEAGGSGAGRAGAGGAGVGGTGAGGAGVGGTGVGGDGVEGAGVVDTGGAVRPRPYFVPVLQQSGGLTERREPASCPISPVRIARCVPRSRPPPVPGTQAMTLRPSSVPRRVPLPAPPESSLLEVPDHEPDRARAASPTVSRLLATAVTDPSFESAVASALVAELLDFAAACRLDYTSAFVAESAFANPPSVGGECALSTDVLEDRQEDFECLAAAVPHFASMLLAPEGDPDVPDIPTPRSYAKAITGPYSSQWQAAMYAEMASWKFTGTYVDEVSPPGANIVDGMWIFRVKRPPGSPPAFKARYVARGFSQRQGVDYFQTFSPTPNMTTLRGNLHEEIWLRCPPGFTESFPAGTQWSLRRPVYGLRQAPRKWHDTLRTTLATLGFAPTTADPSLFLRTDTSLPPFYVLVYVDDLVFATAVTEALTLVKSEL
ncbi:unnamed protein product [Closterium sp. NIES-54]